MTVGVAAVAGRDPNNRRADRSVPTEAIVLVADRRLTYGGKITETWVPKIRGMIGTGASARTTWSALFAGDGSLVDEIKAELVADRKNDRLHRLRRPPLDEVANAVSRAVKIVWDRGYDAYVYEPLGLTRDLFLRRTSKMAALPNAVIEKAVNRAAFFVEELDFGCELALCGFDQRGRSAVLELDERGAITRHYDTGFCAIGEGWDTATARLELLRYQPWMDLGTVLYMAVDAKLTAERVATVGPSTDAWVLLPHRDRPVVVPPSLIAALASVRWEHNRRSPFALPANASDVAGGPPPTDWKDQLWRFVKDCYRGSRALSSPIGRVPPSWLSPLAGKR